MRKLRMIVLDDDEKILQLFRDYFAEGNYEVVTSLKPVVCPIQDALKNSCPEDRTCADVFITDYKMRGMDGLQIIREQLRMGCAMDARNRALISGMYDERLRQEAEKLGCTLFEKPFMFSDVKAWVDERAQQVDLSKPLATLRREPRGIAAREIARMIEQAGERLEAIVVNRSKSGLCLELRSPLAQEKLVQIESDHPDAPRAATVRWVRQREDGSYVAGLHYC